MEPEDNMIWIDKQAYYVLIIVPLLMLIILIPGLADSTFSIIEKSLIGSIVLVFIIYWLVFQPHFRPLKITEKGLVVGVDKPFTFKRKLLKWKEIKKIKIGGSPIHKWDEGKFLEFLRIQDINNVRYRNVIYSTHNFKETLQHLKQKKIIEDLSWYKEWADSK